MSYGISDAFPDLFIDYNLPICKFSTFEHLGNVVGHNALNDSVFGTVFPDIRYNLFKTYRMPLYGCHI